MGGDRDADRATEAGAGLLGERLRVFAAVAGEGGFSRAARALGRTQSSVSQAVLSLERTLGEPLFVRDGRSTRLTEAGRVLLAHAARAFAELGRARAELAALRAVAAGTLVVGTSDTLATYVLPVVLAAFRARYPGVELRLENRPSPAVAARVADGAVDVGVVSLPWPRRLELGGRPARDALRTQTVAHQRDVLVCPPSHALARRRRVRLDELSGEPLVLLDRTTASRALLDDALAVAGVAPRVVMEMNSVEVIKRLVELGFGLSVVPDLAVRAEVARGTLASVALPAPFAAREVALVTSTTGPLSPAPRAFLTTARTELQSFGDTYQNPRSPRR